MKSSAVMCSSLAMVAMDARALDNSDMVQSWDIVGLNMSVLLMRHKYHAAARLVHHCHGALRLAYRGGVVAHASIEQPMSGSIA
jgi:hypothetical protein